MERRNTIDCRGGEVTGGDTRRTTQEGGYDELHIKLHDVRRGDTSCDAHARGRSEKIQKRYFSTAKPHNETGKSAMRRDMSSQRSDIHYTKSRIMSTFGYIMQCTCTRAVARKKFY